MELVKSCHYPHLFGRGLSVLAAGLDELDEPLQRALSVVLHHLVLLGVQLDGGEGSDLGVLQLVDGGVHLGDHHGVVGGVVLSKGVIDGRQLFAMTAPDSDNNKHECYDLMTADHNLIKI